MSAPCVTSLALLTSLPKLQVAQANIDYAGLTSKVKIMLGPAVESLATLPSEQKFDLAFIDADKVSNLSYFLEAERLVRKGGIIVSNRQSSRAAS